MEAAPAMPARNEFINYGRAKVTDAGWLKVQSKDFGGALVNISLKFDKTGREVPYDMLATYTVAVLCANTAGIFSIDPADISGFVSKNATALSAICMSAMGRYMDAVICSVH
jgi:hypothetical protein